jgi:hypothetical protein
LQDADSDEESGSDDEWSCLSWEIYPLGFIYV